MVTSPFLFYVFAAMAIAFSLLVVLSPRPVTSAFSLVLAFFSFAGIYALMDAHLVAALQILVYAGAIMVLFVFVIMLLNADSPTLDFTRSSRAMRFMVAGLCVLGLAIFTRAFRGSPPLTAIGGLGAERIEAMGGNTRLIAELMFSEYILPFELTSVLLLGAIVASIAIAKRKLDSSPAQVTTKARAS